MLFEDNTVLIAYWVDLLNLRDWEITVKTVRRTDLELDGQGEVKYNMTGKQALILLLDPIDWQNDNFKQDQEKTLVHELLHLKFDEIPVKKKFKQKQHQLLNDMAKCLVNVRRGRE